MMGDRGVTAGADPRRDAVRWARRYGKNCLDSRGPGLRERAANIAAPQGPAGKAHAGKGAAVVHKGAAVDESVPTAELGSPSAAQATRKIDSSSEPTATTNSGAAIELLSTEELKAARPRPARRRPVSAHAGTRAARSGPRVSLRGLAKLEERERKLSSVSFCDDRSMAADGRPRGRRPASAKGPGAGAGGAPRRRKARPASAPAVRKGAAASESWPSLPDVDAAESQPAAIETTPSPEPRAAVRRSGGAPKRRGDEYAELHAALDRAHGGGWTERRLVCGAVLDALADTQPQLAGLLRRIGAEIPDREATADDGRAFGSPKLKTRQAPSRTASGCQHCGSFVDKEQAEEMRQEVQRSRERMARAEAAAAHLQRQVALERSRVRELDERLQKLSAEKRPEQQQQQASAGPLRASYESEYSWDSSEEEEQEEREDNEQTQAARVGLSGSLGRPLMGTAAVSLGVTDYAPPRIPAAAVPAKAPPPPPAAATAAASPGAARAAAAPQRVAM